MATPPEGDYCEHGKKENRIVVNGVEHIGCVVCEAPPPTPELIEKLRQLLPPPRRRRPAAGQPADVKPNLGGRPPISSPVQVRLGDLLGKLDAWRAERGLNRAEAVREAVRRLVDGQEGRP